MHAAAALPQGQELGNCMQISKYRRSARRLRVEQAGNRSSPASRISWNGY
jgi:hypothetical protein